MNIDKLVKFNLNRRDRQIFFSQIPRVDNISSNIATWLSASFVNLPSMRFPFLDFRTLITPFHS